VKLLCLETSSRDGAIYITVFENLVTLLISYSEMDEFNLELWTNVKLWAMLAEDQDHKWIVMFHKIEIELKLLGRNRS